MTSSTTQKMRIKTFIITLLLVPLVAMAQFDPSAQKYLDQLSEAVQTGDGLEITFEANVTNLEGKEEVSNEEGTLLLKQDYHKLEIGGTETYGDGQNQWVYFPEEQEVTIQPIEEGELTPASIFTIYKEGYRFRLLSEVTDKVVVELSPNGIASNYVRITLYIDITKQQLDAFAAQGKNGMITSVNITQWAKKTVLDSDVKFDTEKHPDLDIIDLR